MHILTLNTDHLGMGRLGYAGLYTATAEIAKMFQMLGVQVSEVWFGKFGKDEQITAHPISQREAIRLLSEDHVSAIYTQYIQTGYALDLAASAYPYTVPIISICHDLIHQMDTITAWTCNPARHPSDVAVISSEEGAKALRKMLDYAGAGNSFPDADIEVIPLGTFQPSHNLTKATARKERGWDGNDIVYLWFGRFHDSYKADLVPLLLGFREILNGGKVPGARLVAMGADETGKVNQLKKIAERLGIEKHCTWLPNVTTAVRDQCLAGSDILVNVSDHVQETFGIANIEAMANGLPIIAGDWSGFRNIIEDGKTGRLVPTHFDATLLDGINIEALAASPSAVMGLDFPRFVQAMQTLGTDAALRTVMGNNAKNRALNTFSWKALAPRYKGLIEKRFQRAKSMKSRNGPRPWTSKVFSHYATNHFHQKYLLNRGAIELESIVGLVENDLVRDEMIKLCKNITHGGVPYTWEKIEPNAAIPVERIALMKLLKYGVLELGKTGGEEIPGAVKPQPKNV